MNFNDRFKRLFALYSNHSIENAYVNPTLEISKLAKQSKTKVIVISLENQEIKLKRLGIALKECIKNGNWIIVENAGFLKEWSRDVLAFLYVN